GDDGVLQLQRRRHDALQHAVNSEADTEFLFVGLHVDVAGASLDRIRQNNVHQLDNGSFVGGALQVGQLHLLLFRLQFDVGIPGFRHGLHDGFQVFFFTLAVCLLDSFRNRAFRRYHRLDVEAGHELDIVHGEHIGRIGHGDGERCAHTAERQDLVAPRGICRDQLHNCRIYFKIGKVDGRNAVLFRKEIRYILIAEETELNESSAQAAVGFLLQLDGLAQLLRRDDLLFDKKITQTLRHASVSYAMSKKVESETRSRWGL